MKTLVKTLIIFSISLFLSLSTFATPKNDFGKDNSLTNQIIALIGDKVPFNTYETLKVDVSFTVNNKNEIIVVDVTSKNEELSLFIKEKLNNKKINSSKIKQKEIYTLPIKVNKA